MRWDHLEKIGKGDIITINFSKKKKHMNKMSSLIVHPGVP